MRASMFPILLGMPSSLENVAVIVAMVSLVLVASHTYNVVFVHEIMISVSLYNYLHITKFSSRSYTFPYLGRSVAGCITQVYTYLAH